MTERAAGRELRIPAADGYELGATLHVAAEARGAVIVNGATAVPHGFYRRFAAFLAGAGYSTMTLDHRGVGASAPAGGLPGFEATMTDWALADMPGVLDWVTTELGPDRLFLVGHSFGGQVAGMLPEPGRIAGMVTMSSQSGHWRYQGGEQKLLVAFHVHVTLPAVTHTLGYAPWSKLSTGEDLPKGVALQWAAWCRDRRYLLGDEGLPVERFDAFSAPVLADSFGDDKWGTPKSVEVMMRAYPEAERRHVEPAQLGLDRIGHMGAFKPGAEALLGEVVAWMDAV